MVYRDGQGGPSRPSVGLPAGRSTAGRPVPSGYEEEEAAKDHGLKQSPAQPPGCLPSIDETRPDCTGPASRRGSVLGPASSFSRHNSRAGPGQAQVFGVGAHPWAPCPL